MKYILKNAHLYAERSKAASVTNYNEKIRWFQEGAIEEIRSTLFLLFAAKGNDILTNIFALLPSAALCDSSWSRMKCVGYLLVQVEGCFLFFFCDWFFLSHLLIIWQLTSRLKGLPLQGSQLLSSSWLVSLSLYLPWSCKCISKTATALSPGLWFITNCLALLPLPTRELRCQLFIFFLPKHTSGNDFSLLSATGRKTVSLFYFSF